MKKYKFKLDSIPKLFGVVLLVIITLFKALASQSKKFLCDSDHTSLCNMTLEELLEETHPPIPYENNTQIAALSGTATPSPSPSPSPQPPEF